MNHMRKDIFLLFIPCLSFKIVGGICFRLKSFDDDLMMNHIEPHQLLQNHDENELQLF